VDAQAANEQPADASGNALAVNRVVRGQHRGTRGLGRIGDLRHGLPSSWIAQQSYSSHQTSP
jgi:hypothetical protein